MSRLMNLALKGLGFYYRKRGKRKKIIRVLQKKGVRNMNNTLYIDRQAVKVATIQVQGRFMKSTKKYSDYMFEKVSEAASQGAQLIVFPENNGLQLLGMIPGIKKMTENSNKEKDNLEEGLNPGDLFKVVGGTIREVYLTVFSELARIFGVYIIGGSIIAPDENGNLYNTAYLFGPDGSIIGKQDKLHLMPVEKQWGIKPGNTIQVYGTKIGRIAFPVCMDATYFETFRILEEMQAEIVVIPIANPEAYNHWLALRGIWPRVQETMVYGVKSALVGDFLGMTFTGKSGIYCNIDMTKKGNGIIKESESFDKEDIIVGEIDLFKLKRHKTKSELYGDRNIMLYETYFPKIYEASKDR